MTDEGHHGAPWCTVSPQGVASSPNTSENASVNMAEVVNTFGLAVLKEGALADAANMLGWFRVNLGENSDRVKHL